MRTRESKTVTGALLLLFALAAGLLLIIDLPWKNPGINFALLLGYLMLAVPGIVLVLEGTDNLPECMNR